MPTADPIRKRTSLTHVADDNVTRQADYRLNKKENSNVACLAGKSRGSMKVVLLGLPHSWLTDMPLTPHRRRTSSWGRLKPSGWC